MFFNLSLSSIKPQFDDNFQHVVFATIVIGLIVVLVNPYLSILNSEVFINPKTYNYGAATYSIVFRYKCLLYSIITALIFIFIHAKSKQYIINTLQNFKLRTIILLSIFITIAYLSPIFKSADKITSLVQISIDMSILTIILFLAYYIYQYPKNIKYVVYAVIFCILFYIIAQGYMLDSLDSKVSSYFAIKSWVIRSIILIILVR